MSKLKAKKSSKRLYMLDTNVFIQDPMCIFNFDEHDVTVPMTVLEELDVIKSARRSGHINIAKDARMAIHSLNKVINGALGSELSSGVPISKTGGLLRVLAPKEGVECLSSDIADNRIIASALDAQRSLEGSDTTFVLVTNDLNMRIKAKASGIDFVEEYETDQYIQDIDHLVAGCLKVDGDLIERLAEHVDYPEEWGGGVDKSNCSRVSKKALESIVGKVYFNLYLYDDIEAFRVMEIDDDYVCLRHISFKKLNSVEAFDIKPRGLEQAFAMDALLDPSVSMVILSGNAGSGKTLLALAAAIEQSSRKFSNSTGPALYDRIILTRSTPELAEEIGFLPGTEEEKMAPWLMAFSDNMEVLLGDVDQHQSESNEYQNAITTSLITQDCSLQIKSLNFLRGRSLNRSILILDEAQNLSPHQMKSVITRIGQGSKIIVLGNLGQIDSSVTPTSSGLTYAVEAFKDFDGSASVILKGSERSRLAAYAEKNM